MERVLRKFVVPGDFLGVIEEFIPEEGTYEENGNIYSAIAGEATYNYEERILSVKPYRRVYLPLPKTGDIALGIAYDVKDEIAMIRLFYIEGKSKPASHLTGFLHIGQVSLRKKYSNMFEVLRYGDIVRVKVLNSWHPYQLTTRGTRLGVVFARCSRCLTPLVKRRDKLFCRECRAYESRKIASDYGGVILIEKSS